MSKELAQTVRSKKVAALVAILALFTVFATLGSQHEGAKALVLGDGVFTVAQVPDAAPATTTTPGTAGSFTFAYTQNSAAPAINLIFAGSAIPNLTYTSFTGTGAISCTGVGTSAFSCNPGALGPAATLTLVANWTVNNATNGSTIVSAVTNFTAKDGVADATTINPGNPGTNVGTLTIENENIAAVTTDSPGTIFEGGTTTFSSALTNNGSGAGASGVFTATMTITGTPGGTVISGTCPAGGSFSGAGTAVAVCTDNTSLAAGGTGTMTAVVRGNNGSASGSMTATVVLTPGTGNTSPAILTTGSTDLDETTTITQLALSAPATAVNGASVNVCTTNNSTSVALLAGSSSGLNAFTLADYTITGATSSAVATTCAAGQQGVTVSRTTAGTITVVANYNTGGQSNTTTTTFAAALPNLCPGLFHVDPWGKLLLGTVDDNGTPSDTSDDCTKAAPRDVDNNVVGYDHRVCLVGATGTGNQNNINVTAIQPPSTTGIRFNIVNVSGTPNVNGQALVSVIPSNATATDYANGGTFTECVRWYSTAPGEQNITVVDTNGNVIADWADGPTNGADVGTSSGDPVVWTPITSQTPVVKEWNTLLPTTITTAVATAAAPGTNVDQAVTLAPNATSTVTLNAATSRWGGGPVTYYENVWGSHTNASGVATYLVAGAQVKFTKTGTCGTVTVGSATTTVEGAAILTAAAPTVTLTSVGVSIPIVFNTSSTDLVDGCSVLNNSTTGVTIDVTYPNNLGSVNPVIPQEKIQVTWVGTIATKQRFLAWAGQRVILEHDWRILPGDGDYDADTSVDPGQTSALSASNCPFALSPTAPNRFVVKYVRGANSPGNFVEGIGAKTSGNDEALVNVSTNNEQADSEVMLQPTSGPQESCISRVLYESEDPGQVDVEAMVLGTIGSAIVDPGWWNGAWTPLPDNQTKIAFIVYYMKLESVSVSLVDDVAKPKHNASNATYSDYSPGNPWDATKDVTSVDWNVSKDLLVRARVKGWFLNANPSGRAAGTDSNGGGLPAGRWVMPDDWPLLAGGPADPADGSDAKGVAELYSPQFDIMIAPNNGSKYLDTPEGTAGYYTTASALTAALTETGTTLSMVYNPLIVVNTIIRIDNEDMDVKAVVAPTPPSTTATVTVDRARYGTVAAAHAAGAVVSRWVTNGVPFEGPYSLLDLPAIGQSAAVSDYDPVDVRDTQWADGDIDMWDAPMPPAPLTLEIRGAGFIKQVLKQDVYYLGTANTTGIGQTFPNPFYIVDIPDSPFIPAVVGGTYSGGGYLWDTWGPDGPGGVGDHVYRFWTPIPSLYASLPGKNSAGITTDSGVAASALDVAELAQIRAFYGDNTISRTLVVYTDNHGEGMVTANGDFKLDYSGCAANALGGGKHCKPGDKVGASDIYAVADYPDFRGKHYPLMSNVAKVNWTWGGYKDVTIEPGETEQYKYVVFHAMDRDGFCANLLSPAVLLHPVLSGSTTPNGLNNDAWAVSGGGLTRTYQAETVDFMIDSGEGIILTTSNGASSSSVYTKQFAEGVPTFSTYVNDPALTGRKEFPLSSLAATGAIDECQAWVKVSNSLLGILDILVIAHDDEGNIGFDKIIDLQSTMSYSLSFRWTLFTWAGKNNIATADALKGSGGATNDITSSVTAVYGWNAAAQAWLGYFPSAVPVPGANDLTKLIEGDAYWIAITGPGSVTWTIATNVD